VVSLVPARHGRADPSGGWHLPAAMPRWAGADLHRHQYASPGASAACARARSRPDKRGHYAAGCVAGHEARGEVVEVSWATVEDKDRRELMGLEVDLIATHRKQFGSPACQFHGQLET